MYMTTDDDIKYDKSPLGVKHPIGTFEITRDMVLTFAQTTGETNPVFIDEDEIYNRALAY